MLRGLSRPLTCPQQLRHTEWRRGKGCAAGAFLELMMACDRIYALDEDGVDFVIGPLSDGDLDLVPESDQQVEH